MDRTSSSFALLRSFWEQSGRSAADRSAGKPPRAVAPPEAKQAKAADRPEMPQAHRDDEQQKESADAGKAPPPTPPDAGSAASIESETAVPLSQQIYEEPFAADDNSTLEELSPYADAVEPLENYSLYSLPADDGEGADDEAPAAAYSAAAEEEEEEEEEEEAPGKAAAEKPAASDAAEDSDEAPERSPRAGGSDVDWNERFQQLVAERESPKKFSGLAKLAHDFVYAAEIYGRVIISELGLPDDKKTIKPISVGGQAGGEKYIVNGIFFKFALDIFGIYGGDEFAMKAASHDLKGLTHYFNCGIPGLHVPLMALIDYLGFRLIAISILPISASTLKYGSSDGGVTVHKDNRKLNRLMKQAAAKLNVKGHVVGLPHLGHCRLYAPVDIEGHKGLDGRFYVLDFARTFPPERPSATTRTRKGIILYALLRPELVKAYAVPLSSDAFTVWGKADPLKTEHNQEVADATRHLLKRVVPDLASRIDQDEAALRLDEGKVAGVTGEDHIDVISLLHSVGINARHLGRLRRLTKSTEHRKQLLIEMLARAIRKTLFSAFRECVRTSGVPSEEPAKLATVSLFNTVLGKNGKASEKFWQFDIKQKLLFQFEHALTEDELAADCSLRTGLDMLVLFRRIVSLCGVTLTPQALYDMQRAFAAGDAEGHSFKFTLCDIGQFTPTVKHMNLVDIADGTAMFYSALDEQGGDRARILTAALNKFKLASRKMAFDPEILVTLGDMLVEHSRAHSDRQETEQAASALSNALMAFKTALTIKPAYPRCILGMGKIYHAQGNVEEAIAKYQEALAVQPTLAEAHLQLGKVYLRNQQDDQEKALLHLSQAVALNDSLFEALFLLATTRLSALRQLEGEERAKAYEEVADAFEKALSVQQNLEQLDIDSVTSKQGEALLAIFLVALHSPLLMKGVAPKLQELFRLQLDGLSELSDDVLTSLVSRCSLLNSLSVKNCVNISDNGLCLIAKRNVELGELNVAGCPLSDATLEALTEAQGVWSNLETVVLADVPRFTKPVLAKFLSSCQKLTSINLNGLASVDDELVTILCQRCENLGKLHLIGCTELTDESLAALPSQLTVLYLGGDQAKITLEGIENMLDKCCELEELGFEGLSHVPEVAVFSAVSRCPSLSKLTTPQGNEYLYSGRSGMTVYYSNFGTVTFYSDSIGTFYQVSQQAASFFMNGVKLRSRIMANLRMPMGYDVRDSSNNALFAASRNAISGKWNISMPVLRITGMGYHQLMRNYYFEPSGLVTLQVFPGGRTQLRIAAGLNVSIVCCLLHILMATK